MRGFKKTVAGVLTVTALASSMGAFAAVPADVEGTRYEEAIQILAALKIMIGDDDGQFRPNDTIIRAEAAKMAIHALGLEDDAKAAAGESKFPDVSTDYWANGYINLATARGIVIGDDEGNFRPFDKITYSEVMAIFVRALGYERVAESKGGYPQGYMTVGSDNGMSKGISMASNAQIPRGDVAILANNALTVNLMDYTEYGDTPKYEVTDKTLLKDKLYTTKAEGQITAIDSTSLDGASNLKKGQIKVGDSVLDTAHSFNNLLGHNVTYYVQEKTGEDKKVILALSKKDKNATVSIDADLFEEVSEKNGSTVIDYYKKESDKKTTSATLDQDAKLIYNGKAEDMSLELLNMKDKSGNVSLLDTDRNGKYDVVFVTEYQNMVVEEVTQSNKIVDKYNAPTLKLDDEDEDLIFSITRGFEELTVQDLKEYDVLSVAASKDGRYYEILVSNNTVEGKVTGSGEDGIYIGGNAYKIADNYPNDITIGTEGVFYLDSQGKIAAVNTKSTLSNNYAYLLKAYTESNADDVTSFKLFTKEGKEVVLEANNKMRFNGKSGTLSEDVVKKLAGEDGQTVKQLITYSTNSDGKISSIYTAKDNTETGKVDENSFTKNYDLKNAVYNKKLTKIGNVKLTSETVIFDIPDGSTDYSIASLDKFEDEQKYNVIVYDRAEDFSARAIVVTNAAFQTNADAPIAVVSKVVSATNDDDEITDRLYAVQNGKEIQVNAEDSGILVKGDRNKTLEAGDIIQYKTNTKGEIVSIRVLFDVGTKAEEKQEKPADNLEIIYGRVKKKFAGSMNVTVNGGEVMNLQLPSDVKVYSVDTAKTKNQVTVATTGDIQAFDEDEGNRVFVKIYKDIVEEVVIVK